MSAKRADELTRQLRAWDRAYYLEDAPVVDDATYDAALRELCALEEADPSLVRPDSPTRGQWVGVDLTADNHTMLYAPEGFAHGYQTLEDNTELNYMTTAAYAASSARGVRYDDPAFKIVWPLPVAVISDADKAWPKYQP